MATQEQRIEQLERQMRHVLDEIDKVSRFRRTLQETPNNVFGLRQEVAEDFAELDTKIVNGFAAAATRTDIAQLRDTVESGFAAIRERLPPKR
jgi:exonuclease I